MYVLFTPDEEILRSFEMPSEFKNILLFFKMFFPYSCFKTKRRNKISCHLDNMFLNFKHTKFRNSIVNLHFYIFIDINMKFQTAKLN